VGAELLVEGETHAVGNDILFFLMKNFPIRKSSISEAKNLRYADGIGGG
jgi:hypothetical protein